MTKHRPLLRWFGGKWLLAPWIISHMPAHQVYVEPFSGAASVLLRKSRSYAEILNDLDNEIVNIFRVLRSYRANELVEKLRKTPFARAEFTDAFESSDDPVEQARRTIIRSFMGFSSEAVMGRSSGFRSNSTRSGSTPAQDWSNYPDALTIIIERLKGVTIESRPATQIIEKHDGINTLFYIDPPYLFETRARKSRKNYRHEMSDDDHEKLLELLTKLSGNVIVSGYPSGIYNDHLSGWNCVSCSTYADGALPRKEVLWMNFTPSAVNSSQLEMFGECT